MNHGRLSRVHGARSRGPADLAKVTDIPARATHGGARGHDTRDGARGPYNRDSPALGAC